MIPSAMGEVLIKMMRMIVRQRPRQLALRERGGTSGPVRVETLPCYQTSIRRESRRAGAMLEGARRLSADDAHVLRLVKLTAPHRLRQQVGSLRRPVTTMLSNQCGCSRLRGCICHTSTRHGRSSGGDPPRVMRLHRPSGVIKAPEAMTAAASESGSADVGIVTSPRMRRSSMS